MAMIWGQNSANGLGRQASVGHPASFFPRYRSNPVVLNRCSFDLEETMNPLRRIGTYFLLCTLGYVSHPFPAFPQTAPAAVDAGAQPVREGQNDFDFEIGTW